MRRSWLRLVAGALLLGMGAPAGAQALTDLINGAPQEPPAAAPPANAGVPQFPALAGCEASPAGIAPGPRAAVMRQLEQRLAVWRSADFATAPSFTHPRQAEFAFECFRARLDLLELFLPIEQTALDEAAAYQAQWGAQIEAFRTGAMPAGADPRTWWTNASFALAELVLLEETVGDAVAAAQRFRDRILRSTQEAMAEFSRAIESVRANQSVFAASDRAFWLKVLAWRMVEVGREIDRVQLEDLQVEPDDAYTLIAEGAPDFNHRMVPEQIESLFGLMAGLRQARGALVPGEPRDWSAESDRRRFAEELYLLYATERNVEAWVEAEIADRLDSKRLELQLRHLADVAGGMAEAESRTLRDRAWLSFQAEQGILRVQAVSRWRELLTNQRVRLVEAAIALPPR